MNEYTLAYLTRHLITAITDIHAVFTISARLGKNTVSK